MQPLHFALAAFLLFTACSRDPVTESDPRVPGAADDDEPPPGVEREVDARAPATRDAGVVARPVDAAVPEPPAPEDDDDASTTETTPDAGPPPGPTELPSCPSSAPEEFTANASVGGGGGAFKDSPHFRIYGGSDAQSKAAIDMLEAAYSCFVETLCWRSSGLSYNATNDDGPYTKVNIYVVGSLTGAAGVMSSDARAGMSFLRVVSNYLSDPNVTVHEYGHALTYHERGWVDQTRTGAWWETVANWVADTYMTSALCAPAREARGLPEGKTIIDLNKVIGSSFQVLVDGSSGSGNYYQAWPFLTFLTTNLDRYPGLGPTGLRDLFRKHMRNNETPLHVLARVAAPTTVQEIVGRYWARMAYLDIGHPQAQQAFLSQRSRLNFANLDASGSGYRVKSGRRPRYLGANIIPLKGSGTISARVQSADPFTATLVVRSGSSVRYVVLKDGAAEATLSGNDEASLVVVNTPTKLYDYDPFSISAEAARGLDYTVELTGATP
ncbi:MAG: DUF6055 domain-containing protein [Polyangiales bacterium]